MPDLVQTPAQHREPVSRSPSLKPRICNALQAAVTATRHCGQLVVCAAKLGLYSDECLVVVVVCTVTTNHLSIVCIIKGMHAACYIHRPFQVG